MGDQDEPCGDPIPQAPQKILPPHRHSLHVGRSSGGAPTRVRLIRELIGPRAPPRSHSAVRSSSSRVVAPSMCSTASSWSARRADPPPAPGAGRHREQPHRRAPRSCRRVRVARACVRRGVPIAHRCHGTMMRRLVDQVHRVAVALPRGLAEVVLAAGGQLCGPGTSPRCELCARTTILASSPVLRVRWSSGSSSVSAM